MDDIDYNKLKFISKPDQWFIEGSECKCLVAYCCEDSDAIVETDCGIFEGLTDETYLGNVGVPPFKDEEGCPFDEFDIYYNGMCINFLKYSELIKLMEDEKTV